jgi:hypothetical protein
MGIFLQPKVTPFTETKHLFEVKAYRAVAHTLAWFFLLAA